MLTPATQSSTARATNWFRRFSRDNTCFVGIDVGIDHVNVASFGVDQQRAITTDGKPALGWLSRSEFDLPIDPSAPPHPDWVSVVVQCLRDQLPRCVDGERNVAVIALPAPWIHYRTTPESEIESCQDQCDAMFTASIFQSRAHLSSWPVAAGKDQWMIAATAESAARQIAESVADVGYQVQCILPHGVALLSAAPALTSLTPSAVLLLELSGGLIALSNENGCGLCRNLPACNIATGERPFLNELEPWLLEIASEVTATTRYVTRSGGTVDAQSPLLVCGRAAHIHGMDAALATMLGRPVATWRYAGRCRPGDAAHDPGRFDSNIAVSLSLACCGTHSKSRAAKGSTSTRRSAT